jgi:hypothetical protein
MPSTLLIACMPPNYVEHHRQKQRQRLPLVLKLMSALSAVYQPAILTYFVLVRACRDMVADFERVSMAMSEPDADLDALTNKMSRLQVGHRGGRGLAGQRGGGG